MHSDLRSSSHNVNEFNREDEENRGLLFRETGLHKLTSWLLHLCPLIFLLVVLIISSIIVGAANHEEYQNVKGSLKVLREFRDNQNAGYINEIVVSASFRMDGANRVELPCADGYSPITVFKFEGIESGCLCADSSVHSWAYCLTASSSEGCKQVSSVSSKNFFTWRNKKLCYKNLLAADYRRAVNGACTETGFTYDCKIEGVCASAEPKCPITGLVIDAAGTLELDATHKLKIERTQNQLPLLHFDGSISFADCLDDKTGPKTSSAKNYPLYKKQLTGCGDYGDISSFSVATDSETQAELYEQNSWKTADVPYLNNYIDTNDAAKLFAVKRVKVGADAACKDVGNRVGGLSDAATNSIHDSLIISVINIVLCVIGILLAICVLLGKEIRIGKKYICATNPPVYFLLFLVGVVVFLCILQCSLYWVHTADLDDEAERDSYLKSVQEKNCFDATQTGFSKAVSTLRAYLGDYDSTLFGLVVFLFIWAIIWTVVFIVCYVIRKFVLKDVVIRRPE